jgi:hypothetical protein
MESQELLTQVVAVAVDITALLQQAATVALAL